MHESDFNTAASSSAKLRTVMITCGVIGFLMLAGLAAYTWQLQQQVRQLQADARPSSAVEALSDQVDTGAAPSLFNQQPSGPSLFGNAPAAGDPFAHMQQMRQQMDTMMNSLFGGPAPAITGIPGFGGAPGNTLFGADPFSSLGMNQLTINLRETDEALELVIPVREGQEFELSTDVQEDRLTVSGTLSWQQHSSQNGMNSQRQGSSQFSRTVVLPGNVDPTGLMTEHRENEIVISLPKV